MKYWVAKRAAPHAAEALECLGGNGYVEESGCRGCCATRRSTPSGRLGNVAALDVLRATSRAGRVALFWRSASRPGRQRAARRPPRRPQPLIRARRARFEARRWSRTWPWPCRPACWCATRPPRWPTPSARGELGQGGRVYGTLPPVPTPTQYWSARWRREGPRPREADLQAVERFPLAGEAPCESPAWPPRANARPSRAGGRGRAASWTACSLRAGRRRGGDPDSAHGEAWAGTGTALVAALEGLAAGRAGGGSGCSPPTTTSTPCALSAPRLSAHRLHAGAVDRARTQLKPEIPPEGEYGIPLRDELVLEKRYEDDPLRGRRAHRAHHAQPARPRQRDHARDAT